MAVITGAICAAFSIPLASQCPIWPCAQSPPQQSLNPKRLGLCTGLGAMVRLPGGSARPQSSLSSDHSFIMTCSPSPVRLPRPLVFRPGKIVGARCHLKAGRSRPLDSTSMVAQAFAISTGSRRAMLATFMPNFRRLLPPAGQPSRSWFQIRCLLDNAVALPNRVHLVVTDQPIPKSRCRLQGKIGNTNASTDGHPVLPVFCSIAPHKRLSVHSTHQCELSRIPGVCQTFWLRPRF